MKNEETIIQEEQHDEERALYHLTDARVRMCTFGGPADGESALKEIRNVDVEDCSFLLRYPFWHASRFSVHACLMAQDCRAPFWYSENGEITESSIQAVKAVRECNHLTFSHCDIRSEEFGWKSSYIRFSDGTLTSMYPFLDSSHVTLRNISMKAKYAFQYMNDLTIEQCSLDTKDAFWHSRNVVVRDTMIKGEYIGWYSDGLTLINCKIIGTQPFCYCRNLRLINCEMEETDLAFEYSDVTAQIRGHIESVKNPRHGVIVADSIGEIIRSDSVMECDCEIVINDSEAGL